jgi:uncharacterized membrane protein
VTGSGDEAEPSGRPIPGLEAEIERIENRVAAEVVPAWRRATRGESRWPASLAILAMIALQLRLPDDLTPAGRFVLPGVELVLLVVIVAVNPRRINRVQPGVRILGLTLIGLASLVNAWSVVRLVTGLLDGKFMAPIAVADQAGTLLTSGANIWLTNVIIFALWYWELDRGGPGSRATGEDPDPDFLFPQMAESSIDFHHWEPEFVDYAYVSFTNAAAFSPTDTMPLTRWAKLAMIVQSAVSLVTAVLVIARAVNILP